MLDSIILNLINKNSLYRKPTLCNICLICRRHSLLARVHPVRMRSPCVGSTGRTCPPPCTHSPLEDPIHMLIF